MGKGFNNYMCKKFFHPASADNLKRVWMAQKKTDVEKKKQDELRTQYDREQELYQNKALLSKESKERLELNFMYEPPPGVKKIGETDKEDGAEPEYKFEWQRTWGHAPKESYLEKGDEFNEQPFGIQVCQAKCIKCGKYGHMNTDKRCTLYGKSLDHDAPIQNVDQNKLLQEMKAEGLAMRYNSWDMQRELGPNHSMVPEERGVDRIQLLKTMNKEEKKKLLKKLKKMEKKQKKKDKKRRSSGGKSDSDDEWQEKTVGPEDSDRRDSAGIKHEEKRKKKTETTKEEKNRDRSRSPAKRRSSSRDRANRRERSSSRGDRLHREKSRDDRRDRKRSSSIEDRKERKRSISRENRTERKRSRSRERRRERPVSRERRRGGKMENS